MSVAAEELAEDAYATAKHAIDDAAKTLTDAANETAHDAAEVADSIQTASKGVPQWMWIVGFAVVVIGLLMFFS